MLRFKFPRATVLYEQRVMEFRERSCETIQHKILGETTAIPHCSKFSSEKILPFSDHLKRRKIKGLKLIYLKLTYIDKKRYI